ncbi:MULTISPECIES: SDR family NAD(P)-dependent oxidoreductase [Sphingobium]|jgi:NAD(P)-dependent dehydrogenase (short-subunit alcohol dehydrogenase family)|uniref:3-oxoacyl-[acyl-carrier protein] reductase n=2 Tax=Sphingobium fuliginis (strain ATCC 27551) TaxID=336203 RepID=A0A292ZIB8_SPHSA|nr:MULTISPECIES: SDR family NAD(P)-dependent oxidoreductase [Sphingobium]AJR23290.1 short-chain dehydrogenase [Sphingobium sp. YBL2]PNQ04228.1 short-chain dehydrogenase [Sphingobium sp. SA916]QDC39822.1 SDR family oxidoreductase [Sphingobium fuliginis ATCC 27551]QOT73335.1 SDR family oxidoreductase [Sphingobium fuliginis]RYL98096.1 SDR family oxidoreductase [Sphingobium fuliginis]
MAGRLSGKVAIVTGGGQGVGLGIAQVFLREGAKVLITGRTPDKLEAAVAGLKAEGGEAAWIAGTAGVRADAEAAVARAVQLFGGLDILVNNAQTSKPGTMFEDTDDALFALTIESGLYGTFQHMQAAVPHMKEKGGSIINFGSYEGIHGGVGFAAYAATKEAIRGLSRTAARELGKYKVRVNVICPAALSPIAEQWVKDFPEEAEKVMKLIALGYLGDCAEDIGPAVLFLASEDSRYVTGQTINVDGGQMML